jgi:ribulose-phosphate 3-epimerase
MKISASLFSSNGDVFDYSRKLAQSGADYIHLDFLEGTETKFKIYDLPLIGNRLILPLDVHLITKSLSMNEISIFNESNLEYLTIQYENLEDKNDLNLMSSYVGKWGIGLTSGTSLEIVEKFQKQIDYVLIMMTIPGVSGAKLDPLNFKKIDEINKLFPNLQVFVDGGIEHLNAKILRSKKVDLIVSGSYLARAENLSNSILKLKFSEEVSFVSQILVKSKSSPKVLEGADLLEIIKSISDYKIGVTFVVSKNNRLLGIISDGDIRRTLSRYKSETFQMKAKDIMNNDPIYVTPESLIFNMMIKISRYKFKINIVPVIEEDKFLGYVNLN